MNQVISEQQSILNYTGYADIKYPLGTRHPVLVPKLLCTPPNCFFQMHHGHWRPCFDGTIWLHICITDCCACLGGICRILPRLYVPLELIARTARSLTLTVVRYRPCPDFCDHHTTLISVSSDPPRPHPRSSSCPDHQLLQCLDD